MSEDSELNEYYKSIDSQKEDVLKKVQKDMKQVKGLDKDISNLIDEEFMKLL